MWALLLSASLPICTCPLHSCYDTLLSLKTQKIRARACRTKAKLACAWQRITRTTLQIRVLNVNSIRRKERNAVFKHFLAFHCTLAELRLLLCLCPQEELSVKFQFCCLSIPKICELQLHDSYESTMQGNTGNTDFQKGWIFFWNRKQSADKVGAFGKGFWMQILTQKQFLEAKFLVFSHKKEGLLFPNSKDLHFYLVFIHSLKLFWGGFQSAP